MSLALLSNALLSFVFVQEKPFKTDRGLANGNSQNEYNGNELVGQTELDYNPKNSALIFLKMRGKFNRGESFFGVVLVNHHQLGIEGALFQHRRASQRSVKVYPRCGSKKFDFFLVVWYC